jgi:predicted aldo/keto reductase-like oxidoreductase
MDLNIYKNCKIAMNSVLSLSMVLMGMCSSRHISSQALWGTREVIKVEVTAPYKEASIEDKTIKIITDKIQIDKIVSFINLIHKDENNWHSYEPTVQGDSFLKIHFYNKETVIRFVGFSFHEDERFFYTTRSTRIIRKEASAEEAKMFFHLIEITEEEYMDLLKRYRLP